MERQFPRGSEWRKWDLHVHTKDTNKNDQFESADFQCFCVALFQKALKNNISCIGITDYFSIDRYLQVVEFVSSINSNNEFKEEQKSKIKKILLIPNVELRMLPSTSSGRLINIHCIFNPDPDFLSSLTNDFFNSLKDSNGNQMNKQGFIDLGYQSISGIEENEAYKKGIETYHVDLSTLVEIFKSKPNLRDNTLVVVSNSNNDGASGLQAHYKHFENELGSLEAVRRNIYHLSDAVFSGNPKDREFFLGCKDGSPLEKVIAQCGSLKPCVHGSDAHTESQLFEPDDNRYCWIKADLTFEGLKQIVCEPSDRVVVQANKPEEKNSYQVIKSISINSEICKQRIPLNSNLNTIIGGRSTGKSTLLQMIAHRINPALKSGISEFVTTIPPESIDIVWQDNEQNTVRDIEYFPQNYMHEVARKNDKKNQLIQNIISDTDNDELLCDYELFCRNNKIALQTHIDDLFSLQASIVSINGELREKGDKQGLENEINELQSKVGVSVAEMEDARGLIEKYEKIAEEIQLKQTILKKHRDDRKIIAGVSSSEIISASLEYKFNDLSDLNIASIEELYSEIVDEANRKWKAGLIKKTREIEKQISTIEEYIVDCKERTEYIQGVAHIEKNKQYGELNSRLKLEKTKLVEINGLLEKREKLENQKSNLFSTVIDLHCLFLNRLDQLVAEFDLLHDDIAIKLGKKYLSERCEGLLKDFINLQSRERQSFVENWGDEYNSDHQVKAEEFLHMALNERLELKAHKSIKDLTKGLLTQNWFSRSYELIYQGDTFEKMSEGKKAFVILKLLLEFSKKTCPILIDQPEDSLDNRAIYRELVSYVKKKKKDRQVVLVTHNANVVVNADAEEIIVANQNGEDSKNKDEIKFQYTTGSLEFSFDLDECVSTTLDRQGIREHVCEILEGGTIAFRKRESKYSTTLQNH